MLQYENVSTKDMPEWMVKCMSCIHAYTTKGEDLEIKCRCRKGCNFKQEKNRPIYGKTN